MRKHKVIVQFTYPAPETNYPQGTSPEFARKLDELAFRGNTESLLEMLAGQEYSVEVVPVDNG